MTAAVLLEAGLRPVITEGTFFAVGDDGQTVCVYAEFHQIVSHRLGSFLCQHQVIGGASAFIAMALNFNLCGGMRPKPVGILGEGLASFFADSPAIVTKKHVA